VNAHAQQAIILLESRRTAGIQPHLDEAGRLLDKAQMREPNRNAARRQLEVIATMAAAQAKDRASAQAHLDKVKALIGPDDAGAPSGDYETAAGAIEFWQGNYDAALEHFKKTGPDDAYAMFYMAEAMRLKGDRAGAAAMYKKVAAYNQNGLYYALVRPRAIKAAGS